MKEVFYKGDWNNISVSINLFVFNISEIDNLDLLFRTSLSHFVTLGFIVFIIAKPIRSTILVTNETCTQVH